MAALSILEAMDFDQLAGDLSGLTRMAVASHERLGELTVRIVTLQERLRKLIAEAELDQRAGNVSPDDA